MKMNGTLVPFGGGNAIPLVNQRVVIGRDSSCTICLKFSDISRNHCELTLVDGCWFITDLDSKNGIKVNGTCVKRVPLHPRDKIAVGSREFIIHYTFLGIAKATREESQAVTRKPAKPDPLVETVQDIKETVSVPGLKPPVKRRQLSIPKDAVEHLAFDSGMFGLPAVLDGQQTMPLK